MSSPPPKRPSRDHRSIVRDLASFQQEQRLGLAASGAAFWLTISLLPTAIAAVSIFGLVVSPTEVADGIGRLASAAPDSPASLITQRLRLAAAADDRHLTVGLVASAATAIWSASGGIYNLDAAVREAYELPPQRFAEARARALTGAAALILLLGGCALVAPVVVDRSALALTFCLIPPTVITVATIALAALYRAMSRTSWRSVLPGALVASVLASALVSAFIAYASRTSRYQSVYGGLAGGVIAMLGVYVTSYVILLGAGLNRVIEVRRGPGRVGVVRSNHQSPGRPRTR